MDGRRGADVCPSRNRVRRDSGRRGERNGKSDVYADTQNSVTARAAIHPRCSPLGANAVDEGPLSRRRSRTANVWRRQLFKTKGSSAGPPGGEIAGYIWVCNVCSAAVAAHATRG